METAVAFSKIFQYGKTTIPKEVREKLGVRDGDKIVWLVDDNEKIIVSNYKKRIKKSKDLVSKYVITG